MRQPTVQPRGIVARGESLVVDVDVAYGVQHAPGELRHGEHVDLLRQRGEARQPVMQRRFAGILVDGRVLEELLRAVVDLPPRSAFGTASGSDRGCFAAMHTFQNPFSMPKMLGSSMLLDGLGAPIASDSASDAVVAAAAVVAVVADGAGETAVRAERW